MRDSPTVVGPELEAGDVTVRLDGVQEPIVHLDRVPEYDGEVGLEVRSRERLAGQDIIDFREGSVGFFKR